MSKRILGVVRAENSHRPKPVPATSKATSAVYPLPALSRGQACLRCRRRKMRCDAGKPHCDPCIRAGKAEDCEYNDETRLLDLINQLESENTRLRERICELESAASFSAFLPRQGRQSPSEAGSSGSEPGLHSAPLVIQQPRPHMSPIGRQPHQAYEHHPQMLNIVSQQQQQQPMQGMSISLQDPIELHILERLMWIFSRIASAQFSLPQSCVALLATHRGAGALQEAACAAACVFAHPNNGMAAYEAVFVQRAMLALVCAAPGNELHEVQAGVILAVLAFVGGRALEVQRHLGGALRVERALRLKRTDADADRRETWWMLRRAERAWAPVAGELEPESSSLLSDSAIKQECELYGSVPVLAGVVADCCGAQLAARALALVRDAQGCTAGPNFWHDVQTTTNALERLGSVSASPSTAVVVLAAQCLLHCAVGARDQSRTTVAQLVAALNAGEVETMDAVVGWWIMQVRARVAVNDDGARGVLECAVQRARAVWAYVGALRV